MGGSLKKDIRKTILRVRSLQPPQGIVAKNAAIKKRLMQLPEYIKAKTVLLYASFGSEVETHGIITSALNDGKNVCLPIVEDNTRLSIRSISSLADTASGCMGILEPLKEKSNPVSASAIDLVVAPGVAFDRNGNRIGYGRGYYDRLLKKMRCPVVALAFEIQVIESIPHNENDVSVGKIVTEKQVINC